MRSSKRFPRCRRKVLLIKGRKIPRKSLSLANTTSAAGAAEPVSISIERKLQQLQRMLPAGSAEINMETLFQRTADYIFLLEAKINQWELIGGVRFWACTDKKECKTHTHAYAPPKVKLWL
ncbi:hypothetical protein DITRI_Ditri10aG0175900 [Diplodiscus trichospermus]